MSALTICVAIDGSFNESELKKGISQQLAPFIFPDDYQVKSEFTEEELELLCAGIAPEDGNRVYSWALFNYRGRFFGDRNHFRRSEIDMGAFSTKYEHRAIQYYERAMRSSEPRSLFMDVKIAPGMTEAQFLATNPFNFPSTFIFLRNYCWHELAPRWWAECPSEATEDQRKAGNRGKLIEMKCTFQQEFNGELARIMRYKQHPAAWHREFYGRFVERLPYDDWIVWIDTNL